MKKISLVFITCFIASLLIPGSLRSQDPNVIMVICDDLRYFDFTSPDCPVYAPNLAALAERGVSFSDAHANLPVCSPSRASFLSGKYAHNSGYYGYHQQLNHWYNFTNLHPDSSIINTFKNNGYKTILAGKIYHDSPDSLYENASDFYDRFGNHGPFVTDGNSAQPYPGSPEIGITHHNSSGPIVEFPEEDSVYWALEGDTFEVDGDTVVDLLPDELITEKAIDELSQVQSDPFFMVLGHFRPHLPFFAPKEFFDLYDIENMVIPEHYNGLILKSAIASFKNSWGSNGETFYSFLQDESAGQAIEDLWLKKYLRAYYASVSFVDHQIGLLMNALDSSDYASNTLLLLTSDNGFYLGDYAKFANKNGMRSPSSKIPMILYGPGIPEDTVISDPVSLIDIYPTLSNFAFGDIPDGLDGHDILPLVDNSFGNWEGEDFTLQEVASNEKIILGTLANTNHQHHSICNSNYRYTLFSDGEEEFYDRTLDPLELTNIAGSPEIQSIRSLMNSQLVNATNVNALNYDPLDHIILGGFENDFNGWDINSVLGNNLGSIIDIDPDDKHCKIEKTNTDYTFIENKGIFLENGKTYRLTFKAKADQSNLELKTQMWHTEDILPPVSWNNITYSINNSWTEYEHTFTYSLESTKRKAGLRLVFQNIGTYEIDDVCIIDVASCHQDNFEDPINNPEIEVFGETINFNWDPFLGSTKCQFQGNLSSAPINSNISFLIPLGTDFSEFPPTETFTYPLNIPLSNGNIILYDQEYRWRVRCGCSVNPIIANPFNEFEYFTIEDPGLHLQDSQNKLNDQVIMYPNPNSTGELFLNKENLRSLSLFDPKMDLVKQYNVKKGQQKFDISGLSKGNYIVRMQIGNILEDHNLIIQ